MDYKMTADNNLDNRASGSLLEKLISNPEAMSALISLIKPKAETQSAQPAFAPGALNTLMSAAPGNPSMDKIGQLFSNPDFMQKLPGLISAMGPILSGLHDSGIATPEAQAQPVFSPAVQDRPIQDRPVPDDPLPGSGGAEPAGLFGLGALPSRLPSPLPIKKGLGRHYALLMALKPYLGQGRSQAIDYIVKITQLTDVFRSM